MVDYIIVTCIVGLIVCILNSVVGCVPCLIGLGVLRNRIVIHRYWVYLGVSLHSVVLGGIGILWVLIYNVVIYGVVLIIRVRIGIATLVALIRGILLWVGLLAIGIISGYRLWLREWYNGYCRYWCGIRHRYVHWC